MSEFPPDWYEYRAKQEAARSWSDESRDAPKAEWVARLEGILSTVEFVRADESHESKWAELRIDVDPRLAPEASNLDENKRYFNDDGLNDYFIQEMSDQRPKLTGSIGRSSGDVTYAVSLETRDPRDNDYIVTTSYCWSYRFGYVVVSRTHIDDMLSSASSIRSTLEERRIKPSDYTEIKVFLGILTDAGEEGSIKFNGLA